MRFPFLIGVLLIWICSIGKLQAQSGCLVVISDAQKDGHFHQTTLPFLKKLAESQQLDLQEIEASSGIPNEITTSPAIVLVNARGNSIYTGRYTDHLRIKSFVRTARILAQPDQINRREKVAAYTQGRSISAAVLKVTPVKIGEKAEAFKNQLPEESKLKEVILMALDKLKMQDEWLMHKTDRTFFFDFHPFISADQRLYLSCALYSQFHCTIPVFQNYDKPIVADLNNWKEAFAEAGRLMEKQMLATIASSELGDAYSAIELATPNKPWSELGCTFDDSSNSMAQASVPADKSLPLAWGQPLPLDDFSPLLQFNFLAPLDWYSGEVGEMEAKLQLGNENQLVAGEFVADLTGLSMGNADLNQKILKKYLKVSKYPKAVFVMESVDKHLPLQWGETTSIQLYGKMKLLSKTHPVAVKATLTPFANGKGDLQMALSAQFSLNITDDYGIKGPENGPMESRKNMEFNLNCLLQPNGIQVGKEAGKK